MSSSPRDRLYAILQNVTPRKVVFTGVLKDGYLLLVPTVTTPTTWKESSDPIQEYLKNYVHEVWDTGYHKQVISTSVTDLWSNVKSIVSREYERVTSRSPATIRKTMDFIRRITLDDKHLCNFILETFVKISSDAWKRTQREEQRIHFENFESLRRVYGK